MVEPSYENYKPGMAERKSAHEIRHAIRQAPNYSCIAQRFQRNKWHGAIFWIKIKIVLKHTTLIKI